MTNSESLPDIDNVDYPYLPDNYRPPCGCLCCRTKGEISDDRGCVYGSTYNQSDSKNS